jgi:hypothetical protein
LEFRSGREADHSPPSRAEVNEWVELYLHSPNTPSRRGVQLGRAQGFLELEFRMLNLEQDISSWWAFLQLLWKASS